MIRRILFALAFLSFKYGFALSDDVPQSLAKEAFIKEHPTIITNLGGGIAGGLQDDEKQPVNVRARSFDVEHTYVRLLQTFIAEHEKHFGKLFSQLSATERQSLVEVCANRVASHNSNYAPIRSLLDYKIVASIRGSSASVEGQKQLMLDRNLSEDARPPTKDEENAALIDYKRNEIESEQQFADAVLEVLTPQQQDLFLRPFSKFGSQFIVHPFGVYYLNINEDQLIRLRRQVSIEFAVSAGTVREVFKQAPDFASAKSKDQRDVFSQDRLAKIWEAQFQTLLLLDRDQLTRYIRLKYDLLPSKTINDWIESITDEARRKIAREMFADRFK